MSDLDLPDIPVPVLDGQEEAGNPPPALAGGGAGFSSLSAEDRAAILAVAMDFGITNQHDPIFQVIAALGWHLRMYERIPADVTSAGERTAETLSKAIEDASSVLIAVRDGLKTEFSDQVSSAVKEVQLRATKGMLDILKTADTQKIVREIAAHAARDAAITRARGLLGLGLTICGLLIAGALGLGVWMGHSLAQDPQAALAKFYQSQLTCSTRGTVRVCALTADPRQVVTFREPAAQ